MIIMHNKTTIQVESLYYYVYINLQPAEILFLFHVDRCCIAVRTVSVPVPPLLVQDTDC